MPVTKSAQKARRRDRRREKINLLIKNEYKTLLKKVRRKPTITTLSQACRILDRAAKKKVIHKNKAARLKSRLAKLLSRKTPVKVKKSVSRKPAKKSKKTKNPSLG